MDIATFDHFEEELMTADGLGDAIIGVGHRCGQPPVVVYEYKKVIEILMTRDGMSQEDAEEFFTFNIGGAWMGEQTPMWMSRIVKE